MESKTTNRKAGKTLPALVLDTYAEYVTNGYPTDPEIYFIRANEETVERMLRYHIVNTRFISDSKRFMGFKVESDSRLLDNQVLFGPETVQINWDGE